MEVFVTFASLFSHFFFFSFSICFFLWFRLFNLFINTYVWKSQNENSLEDKFKIDVRREPCNSPKKYCQIQSHRYAVSLSRSLFPQNYRLITRQLWNVALVLKRISLVKNISWNISTNSFFSENSLIAKLEKRKTFFFFFKQPNSTSFLWF